MLDSVEDHDDNNLVRHDACLCQKIFVALLDALYCSLKHVLGLAIDTDTDGQLNMALFRAFEKR